MKDQRIPSLHLVLEAEQIPRFFQLLQVGFTVRTRGGASLKAILCEQPGISPEYLADRIQTIFLNGKAVDDLEGAVPAEGSTIALSAAMPGLVGATFRKGGFYNALRSQITYREEEASSSGGEGFIRLKLFNLLIPELGPTFLEQGVGVNRRVLLNFLRDQPPEFWAGCKGVQLDGSEVKVEALREANPSLEDEIVCLRVISQS